MARESGISENSLNNLFRRNNLPTIPTLEALCGGFDITLSQFFADGKEAVVLNESQQEMLSMWNTLNENQKTKLLEFIKTI